LERQHHPWVLLRLLHAERDLFLGWIHLEHYRLDGLTDGHELRWMPHVAGPAHLADMDQALDARLQLHEGAVVGDAHDLALHPGTRRILLVHLLPGVFLELLAAEGDALALPIDVQDFYFNILTDLDHFRRM